MNLNSIIKENADRLPKSPSIIDGVTGLIISYQELWERIDKVAFWPRVNWYKKGDRVAIYLPNGPEFIISYFGIMKIGAIAVPFNILFRSSEIQYIMSNSGAKAIIGWEQELKDNLMPIRNYLDGLNVLIGVGGHRIVSDILLSDWLDADGHVLMAEVEENHPACILYTSGTTGRPKGATLSHSNIAANAKINAHLLGINDQDRALGCSPFNHVYFVQIVLGPLFSGACVITLPRSSPELALEAISKFHVTHFSTVPTMFLYMLQRFKELDYDLSSWRIAGSAAASISQGTVKEVVNTFGVDFMEAYGSTEISSTATYTRLRHPRPGSIGLPAPGYKVRIINNNYNEVKLGEIGELIVKGPGVFQGYWGMPESTAEALTEDGWFKTGDLARQDNEGYFYIVDRKKDMIISGGYNIYPRELEEVLMTHPDIIEAAIIGKPNENLGEVPAAFIILRTGVTLSSEDIIKFCREGMAKYKIPKVVEITNDLPRTA